MTIECDHEYGLCIDSTKPGGQLWCDRCQAILTENIDEWITDGKPLGKNMKHKKQRDFTPKAPKFPIYKASNVAELMEVLKKLPPDAKMFTLDEANYGLIEVYQGTVMNTVARIDLTGIDL